MLISIFKHLLILKKRGKMSKLAITVTTFLRNDLLETCIGCLLKWKPKDSIILIGDQGLRNIDIKKKEHYENLGCYFYILPFDCCLSYARNHLVEQARNMGADYTVIMSDSMMFNEKTKDIDKLIQYMDKYDIIGCHLKGNVPCYWVGNLSLIPGKCFHLNFIDRQNIINAPNGIFDCNIIHNFFLAKTESLFNVKWDNNLRLAEHEDFMYRYVQQGFRIGWTPNVSCDYFKTRSGVHADYRMKNWTEGLEILKRKWGIKGWIEYENLHLGKWGI
jgi:hypothetical protein